jgi:hypothetical protein
MLTKRVLEGLLVVSVMLASTLLPGCGKTGKKNVTESQIAIGTFDSRAVKLACDHSKSFADRINAQRQAGLQNATPEQIQQWTIDQRQREFRQGFGTGDVSEYLDLIRDEIPRIAQKAGIKVIVSAWDIEYQDPQVQFVDVTDAFIQPFNPTQETLEVIQDVLNVSPYSERQIQQLEMRGDEGWPSKR